MSEGRPVGMHVLMRNRLDTTIVEIIIRRKTTKTFIIHKSVLVKHSDVFKAAKNGSWAESESGKVTLPEHNVESFELFANFLYNGKVASAKHGDIESATATVTCDSEWATLGNAWCLEQQLLSTNFKDAISDALLAKISASSIIR